MNRLGDRLERFNLEVASKKTQILESGRFAKGNAI